MGGEDKHGSLTLVDMYSNALDAVPNAKLAILCCLK
jgi:hypothetical protein